MASLFTGTPATTYTSSNTETPKWMQDAIYSQIQSAGNVANTPYQPYQLPIVAGLSNLQTKAIEDAQTNQGTWKPGLTAAQTGMGALSTGTAATSAAQPYINQAQQFTSQAGGAETANQYRADQAAYLNPGLAGQALQSGQGYINQAGQTTAQSLSERALAAASPYLQAASGSSAPGIAQYMSPYQDNAMGAMARISGRNLSENLLPNVSDSFIKAGQFGSNRMGEFGSRALRDTQESLINQQSQLANQGFSQALGASQADLSRQAQLAGTVGNISGADLSRVLQGAGQYGNLGQAQSSTGQAQQQFGLSASQSALAAQQADIARQMQAGQQMGSFGATVGGLAGSDASRQTSALSQMANMSQQQQQQSSADVASMSAAGQQQQQQQQAELSAAYKQYQEQLMYPKQQLDWMNTQIRGMAPITPQAQYSTATGNTGASPLTQLAGATAAGMGIYKMANQ